MRYNILSGFYENHYLILYYVLQYVLLLPISYMLNIIYNNYKKKSAGSFISLTLFNYEFLFV